MKKKDIYVDKVYRLTKDAAPLSFMLPTRNSHSLLGAAAEKMKIGDCVEDDKFQVVSMCQAIRRRYGNGSATMRKLTDDTWRVWRNK